MKSMAMILLITFSYFIMILLSTTTIDCHRRGVNNSTKVGITNIKNNKNKYQINEKIKNAGRTSMPSPSIRLFQCIRIFDILKCLKIFIVQRLEKSTINSGTNNNSNTTGNFTIDKFFKQILIDYNNNKAEQQLDNNNNNNNTTAKYNELLRAQYFKLNESELDKRLVKSIQTFFKNNDIKLYFIPGIIIKIVPNELNAIKLSVKRIENYLNLGKNSGRKKKTTHEYMVQFGLPALMMPAILMGTVLPFIIPALKMATLMSGILNNGALLAAIMYATKSASDSNEINYH